MVESFLEPAVMEARDGPLHEIVHEDGEKTSFYADIHVKALDNKAVKMLTQRKTHCQGKWTKKIQGISVMKPFSF